MDPDKLVEEYRLYDRAVDIVSIYHWLFTESKELAGTVAHFERYPRIPIADGAVLTPDFTVLFKDGRGIVGEIANVARHDGSVESICSQLDKYSRLAELPDADGGLSPAAPVDVTFLTPMETATAAVRRIFTERLDNPEHWYKPPRRPVAVQFALTPDNYVLQIWADASVNGSLAAGGPANYRDFDDLKVPPDRFARNKVKYAFMNDPVKPLYLATRLWTSVFPSRFGTSEEFVATTSAIAQIMQEQYGHVRTNDVEAAMEILRAAGLTIQTDAGWRVRRRKLRLVGADIHEAIARLVDRSPADSRARRAVSVSTPALFELDPGTGELTDSDSTAP